MRYLIALLFLVSSAAFAASPPTVSLSASGSSATVSPTDGVTTGFDIYLDGSYFMSVNNVSAGVSVTVNLLSQSFCTVSAAAWEGGGLNHSTMSNLVTNFASAICGTVPPVTVPLTTGVCIDSTAYVASTGAVLSSTTHCY